ncbi:MAG TPA: alpha/beta hydrolase, partial [Rheinheimera sp.]|nr:alpha/beta hydrolase [Rheinheimera sp.]
MSQHALRVLAGPTALAQIKQHGFNQADFNVMVGASGGPKWFCLYGLDQYLFGSFFRQRSTPLHILGSSAGAWR